MMSCDVWYAGMCLPSLALKLGRKKRKFFFLLNAHHGSIPPESHCLQRRKGKGSGISLVLFTQTLCVTFSCSLSSKLDWLPCRLQRPHRRLCDACEAESMEVGHLCTKTLKLLSFQPWGQISYCDLFSHALLKWLIPPSDVYHLMSTLPVLLTCCLQANYKESEAVLCCVFLTPPDTLRRGKRCFSTWKLSYKHGLN